MHRSSDCSHCVHNTNPGAFMALQFICSDPSLRVVYLIKKGRCLSAPYSEAVVNPKIADALPDRLISAICHTLHQDTEKKIKAFK